MLDSSSKTPDGILKGNTYSLGNFDECIGAANENFTGQYCLADTAIQIPAELKKKYSAFIFPHRVSSKVTFVGVEEIGGGGLNLPKTKAIAKED